MLCKVIIIHYTQVYLNLLVMAELLVISKILYYILYITEVLFYIYIA